jgi:membrane protein YqaA with SNARE-associated domain
MSNIADMLLILLVVFALISFFILRKNKGLKKFFFFLFLIIFLLSLYVFRSNILNFLKSIPFVWNIVGPIITEIASNSLLGLFYLSTFGSLFFISIPIEFVFIYYLTLNYNPFVVLLIATLGSIIGLVFNYCFGFILGEGILKYFLKDKYDNFKKLLEKFGSFLVFAGNIIPSPIELASVVFGAARFSFKKFVVYSLLGRVFKFGLTIWLGDIFSDRIIPYFKNLF